MKKRLLAVIAAAAMVMTSAMGVFAAGSQTTSIKAVQNETTDANNYYETTKNIASAPSFIALKEIVPEVTALIEQVNSGAISSEKFLEEIASLEGVSEEVKQNVEGKEMLTDVFDLEKVGEPQKVNGKYRVTLEIPGLTANTTGLGLLHLTSAGVWEYIPVVEGSIDLTKKTASFDFDSFSPVLLVADEGTFDTTATTSDKTSTTSDKKTDSTSKSPKTSQSSDWMVWAVMAALLAGAGVVVLRKKAN